MTNRYSFINRKTGKRANLKHVRTRDDARAIKWATGFRVAIYDKVRGEVVR